MSFRTIAERRTEENARIAAENRRLEAEREAARIAASERARAVASARDQGLAELANTFQYAIVRDANGTELLHNNEVYPIVATVKAPAGYDQGISGHGSVRLTFEENVHILKGVRTPRGKVAKPYFWDTRRFFVVSFNSLTSSQKSEALRRFGL